jgi:hypothetical protein
MANCNKCAYSVPYWNVKLKTGESRCISPHDKSMVTKEGEHECDGYNEVEEITNQTKENK